MAALLNPAQQKAATHGDGPLVIVAGPGTGKTKTLTARIGFLVQLGVRPQQILALTFTKKAAAEMRARLGEPADKAYVSTFHALCFELLTQKRGQAPRFIAEPARLALIKSLAKPAELKGVSVRELSLLISRAKNMASPPNKAIDTLTARYNRELAARQLHDFDDLLLQVRDTLLADSAWLADVQSRFAHILVDEFQDTNALQYELLQLIRGTDNICVIGDPQQSIYGFRGADGDIFTRFGRDFPAAVHIALTANYRSQPAIVNAANAVYPQAAALISQNADGGVVQAVEVLNEYGEAEWVLNQIQKAVGGSDLLRAVSDDDRSAHRGFADFAVLYRSRSAARAVQQAFAQSGVPYQVVGDGSPYDQPQVQAVIGVLAKVADLAREVEVAGFSAAQLSAFAAALDATARPHAIAETVIAKLGTPLTRDLRQLLSVLYRFATVDQATAYFDELSAQQFYDPRADAVTLLTIHAAKGLEFAQVFLVGAEEGILPSARGELPEEKRLFYVALTRAKDRLDVLHARKRGGQPAKRSRFITDISSQVLPRITDPSLANQQKRAQKRQAKRAQTSLF